MALKIHFHTAKGNVLMRTALSWETQVVIYRPDLKVELEFCFFGIAEDKWQHLNIRWKVGIMVISVKMGAKLEWQPEEMDTQGCVALARRSWCSKTWAKTAMMALLDLKTKEFQDASKLISVLTVKLLSQTHILHYSVSHTSSPSTKQQAKSLEKSIYNTRVGTKSSGELTLQTFLNQRFLENWFTNTTFCLPPVVDKAKVPPKDMSCTWLSQGQILSKWNSYFKFLFLSLFHRSLSFSPLLYLYPSKFYSYFRKFTNAIY